MACAAMVRVLLLCAVAAPVLAMEPTVVPVPSVDGPIPVTATSHPYSAAAWQQVPVDLGAAGYVEEELFLRGRANVYAYDAGKNVTIETANAPYVNRIVVRRPADPNRFNGKVIVELFNASGAADVSFAWANMLRYLLSQGYGYVGVTSKPIAVAKLKTFDPKRYSPLSWANPKPLSSSCGNPGPAGLFTGWSTPQTEDGLLWDIAAQTGALIRSKAQHNPFAGYGVEAVYLTGHSQSGAYVGEYARDFQDVLRLADGKPIFDGFLQTGSSGLSLINQCTQALPYSDPHVRMRSSTPFIRIMTLTDFYNYDPIFPYLLRREDSDAADDKFRLYEAAGAQHVSADIARFNPSESEMKRAGLPPRRRATCVEMVPSDFPMSPIFDVAIEHLDQWRKGVAPPHAKQILVDHPGQRDARAVLDADGNVQGGVRTPAIDVPRAAYAGKSGLVPGNPEPACRNQDHMIPFGSARLKELYPTREAYIGKVQESVDQLYRARWLTEWDAQQIRAAAQSATGF